MTQGLEQEKSPISILWVHPVDMQVYLGVVEKYTLHLNVGNALTVPIQQKGWPN